MEKIYQIWNKWNVWETTTFQILVTILNESGSKQYQALSKTDMASHWSKSWEVLEAVLSHLIKYSLYRDNLLSVVTTHDNCQIISNSNRIEWSTVCNHDSEFMNHTSNKQNWMTAKWELDFLIMSVWELDDKMSSVLSIDHNRYNFPSK